MSAFVFSPFVLSNSSTGVSFLDLGAYIGSIGLGEGIGVLGFCVGFLDHGARGSVQH